MMIVRRGLSCALLVAMVAAFGLVASGCSSAAPVADDPGAETDDEEGAEASEAGEVAEADESEGEMASETGENPRLYPVEVDEKWGYIDASGEIVIEPEYDVAFPFSDGWGRVYRDGNYSFVDAHGDVQLSTELAWVDDFSEGLAAAKAEERTNDNVREGIFGYIDREGEWAISPQYKQAYPFSEGLAPVDVNVGDDPPHGATGAAKFAYIEPDGTVAIDEIYDGAMRFREGTAPVQVGYHWGYIDSSGNIVIEPQFQTAKPFSEGRAAVTSTSMTGEWFFIDEDGEPISDHEWEVARSFQDGLAAVAEHDRGSLNTRWSYVDRDGEPVFGEYHFAERFYQGLGRVAMSGDLGASYLSVGGEPSFGEGIFSSTTEFYPQFQWHWVDTDGNIVWPAADDDNDSRPVELK